MADNRTMEELLQAPMEGYGEAIVILTINADHFEIKTNLLQLVQANPYHGFGREDPHTHINNFKRITSTLKFRDVPNYVIKLMMFPYSLEGNSRVWRQNKRRTPNVVEPELRTIVEIVDNRTMEEVLQAPMEGYGEAIVILTINADHFEIKTNLLQLVQANPYHGFGREDPHTHINNFKRITSTLKFRDVPNYVIKLMMFPYSLEGNSRVWMNTTSREYASKTDDRIDKLANQISTLVDIFAKKVDRIDKLADQILTLVDIFAKKVVTSAPVKAVEESYVTCGGAHAYYNCPNIDIN
nr:reverse transcriptase domain-containing protein [Tanacetum cinerariifolium]